jgi:amino acid transporter
VNYLLAQRTFLLAVFGVLAVVPMVANDYFVFVANMMMVFMILALGLNILIGYAGQLALANAAMFGIGAYATGLLQVKLGLPYWIGAPVGAVIAMSIGTVMALPALRLSGIYLALLTLAFAMVVQWVFLHWDSVTFGAGGFPAPRLDLSPLQLDPDTAIYYLSFVVTIAMLAFVFGDYVARLPGLEGVGPPALAAAAVILLTAVNVAGIRPGRGPQYALTGTTLVGIAVVAAVGLLAPAPAPGGGAEAVGAGGGTSSPGLALIFVFLAFGGWSEGAYVSAEIRDRSRGIGRVLLWGTGAITLLYLLANAAFLAGLGLEGVAASDAVAADLLERVAGPWGRRAVSGAIILAALSSANATVLTGARSNYALGRDWPIFGLLGRWREDREAPVPALLVQGAIALLLVGFGAVQRSGFEAMVEYTAPVFWLVLLFTGAAVIVQRRRDPGAERPYRVPAYPLTPLLFCASAAYMVYSSVQNAGDGALLGLAVMALGLPFLWLTDPDPATGRGDDEAA